MNKVEFAVCRIRQVLPKNEGSLTRGSGCVVKCEWLSNARGWKCQYVLVTSSNVVHRDELSSGKAFVADFLLKDNKGLETFDLKLAADTSVDIPGRNLWEATKNVQDEKYPGKEQSVTVISVEKLDKRGFLKRMTKKRSLQTTRPLECFNTANLNEELSEGLYCHVIRESEHEFSTRTYKFLVVAETRRFVLQDFGNTEIKTLREFPNDEMPLGAVIYTKRGEFVGLLEFSEETNIVEPCFLPVEERLSAEDLTSASINTSTGTASIEEACSAVGPTDISVTKLQASDDSFVSDPATLPPSVVAENCDKVIVKEHTEDGDLAGSSSEQNYCNDVEGPKDEMQNAEVDIKDNIGLDEIVMSVEGAANDLKFEEDGELLENTSEVHSSSGFANGDMSISEESTLNSVTGIDQSKVDDQSGSATGELLESTAVSEEHSSSGETTVPDELQSTEFDSEEQSENESAIALTHTSAENDTEVSRAYESSGAAHDNLSDKEPSVQNDEGEEIPNMLDTAAADIGTHIELVDDKADSVSDTREQSVPFQIPEIHIETVSDPHNLDKDSVEEILSTRSADADVEEEKGEVKYPENSHEEPIEKLARVESEEKELHVDEVGRKVEEAGDIGKEEEEEAQGERDEEESEDKDKVSEDKEGAREAKSAKTTEEKERSEQTELGPAFVTVKEGRESDEEDPTLDQDQEEDKVTPPQIDEGKEGETVAMQDIEDEEREEKEGRTGVMDKEDTESEEKEEKDAAMDKKECEESEDVHGEEQRANGKEEEAIAEGSEEKHEGEDEHYDVKVQNRGEKGEGEEGEEEDLQVQNRGEKGEGEEGDEEDLQLQNQGEEESEEVHKRGEKEEEEEVGEGEEEEGEGEEEEEEEEEEVVKDVQVHNHREKGEEEEEEGEEEEVVEEAEIRGDKDEEVEGDGNEDDAPRERKVTVPLVKQEADEKEEEDDNISDIVAQRIDADSLLSEIITNNSRILDELASCLDTDYQYSLLPGWHDLADLLAIPPETYEHYDVYSVSSPTEDLFVFLSSTKPDLTMKDIRDALVEIGRADVVHIMDKFRTHNLISNESVVGSLVEREDRDLLGKLALKLDRGSTNTWKHLAVQLAVPRCVFRKFGSNQGCNPALLLLKYLPIFDPELTIADLKEVLEKILRDNVIAILDSSRIPDDEYVRDILDDTELMDQITDLLNEEPPTPNWRHLACELKVPQEKCKLFEPTEDERSCTKLLFRSIEKSEPDITVEELILALVAMKRQDVLDVLAKYLDGDDIDSILEENNLLLDASRNSSSGDDTAN